jgi:N6-L-threonylcarbamoyladenine synthase
MPLMAPGSALEPIRFSYSGLKTFMAQTIHKQHKKTQAEPSSWGQDLWDLCAAFQEEALGQIVRKTKRALTLRPDAKSILIAGGVAANQHLRTMMARQIDRPCHYPPPSACSDNGAMIATYAFYQHLEAQKNPSKDTAAYFDHRWESYSRYAFDCKD